MKKTIIFFTLFALCNLLYSQNKKPVTKPDTLKWGDRMNVLANDKDPNGDRMTVNRFNGFDLGKINSQIQKKDTGVFTIDSSGNFHVLWEPRFYGKVTLTYYVNDGKAGAGKTVNIVLYSNIEIGCPVRAAKENGVVYAYIECWRFKGTPYKDELGYWVKYKDTKHEGHFPISREQYEYLIKP